jgi:hypothetical protein
MTFAGLVDAGEDRIHNAEPRAASNAAARSALFRAHRPIGVGGGFERPDYARPNRDNAP